MILRFIMDAAVQNIKGHIYAQATLKFLFSCVLETPLNVIEHLDWTFSSCLSSSVSLDFSQASLVLSSNSYKPVLCVFCTTHCFIQPVWTQTHIK